MYIYERDTGLLWRWTGSDFVRAHGSGLLRKSNGTPAYNSRVTDFSTTNTTSFVLALAVTSVVVPAGTRPIVVEANVRRIFNSAGANTLVALCQGSTSGSTPVLYVWNPVDLSGTIRYCANAGLAAGTYDFSLQLQVGASGTSTLATTATVPAEIRVYEL